jgi:hypothetical protein
MRDALTTKNQNDALPIFISCWGGQDLPEGVAEYKSKKYAVMWYKNSKSIGIRKKFGDCKQIWSFGGSRCGLSQEQQRGFAEMCLKKLDGGMSESSVKTWVDEAVGN